MLESDSSPSLATKAAKFQASSSLGPRLEAQVHRKLDLYGMRSAITDKLCLLLLHSASVNNVLLADGSAVRAPMPVMLVSSTSVRDTHRTPRARGSACRQWRCPTHAQPQHIFTRICYVEACQLEVWPTKTCSVSTGVIYGEASSYCLHDPLCRAAR